MLGPSPPIAPIRTTPPLPLQRHPTHPRSPLGGRGDHPYLCPTASSRSLGRGTRGDEHRAFCDCINSCTTSPTYALVYHVELSCARSHFSCSRSHLSCFPSFSRCLAGASTASCELRGRRPTERLGGCPACWKRDQSGHQIDAGAALAPACRSAIVRSSIVRRAAASPTRHSRYQVVRSHAQTVHRPHTEETMMLACSSVRGAEPPR